MRFAGFAGLISCFALACAVLARPADAAPLLQNGDFEVGPDASAKGYLPLFAGDTSIPGWTVIGADGCSQCGVDYIDNYWQDAQSALGTTNSIDLSGNDPGGVAQTFSTDAGQKYEVTFWIAGNPDASSDKTGQVQVSTGGQTQDFTFTQDSKTKAHMGWVELTYSFVADAAQTTLTFLSTTTGPWGPALDNVSVSAVPLPGALLLFGTALAGIGLFGRRRVMNAVPA
jgi:choice-of-anchor C domain-containing protein